MAILAYAVVPSSDARDVIRLLIGLSSVGAVLIGVRWYQPTPRVAWYLMAAGLAVWTVGDTVRAVDNHFGSAHSFPSVADGFYLASYPIVAAGLFLLSYSRRAAKRDLGGLLDSATVTAGLGLLTWELLARPTSQAWHHSFAAAAVAVAYPIVDILLMAVLVRLMTSNGSPPAALGMLWGAVGLLIAADSASSALRLFTSIDSGTYSLLWLASHVLWGVAALHPSMPGIQKQAPPSELGFTRRRLAILTVATLAAPGTLAVQRIVGESIDVWAVVIGSVTMFVLVVTRMAVAIDQIVTANRHLDQLQATLVHQAAHDALTGLANRAQALKLIESALSRSQRTGAIVALLFVDLDGFKAVNDTMGHRAGDDALRIVANRLQAAVRTGDVVARLGGDEFVVLLEDIDMESSTIKVADRLIMAASVPIMLAGRREVRMGASIGIAVSMDGSTRPESLLQEADAALYRAKLSGRGRAELFSDSLRREISARVELEAALANAIENDELYLDYQPIVSVLTGEIEGYEALVRWDRAGFGLVSPAQFIPIAEKSSLIFDVGTWVLNEATRQLAAWNRTTGSQHLTIAVNISGRHISTPRILLDVATALRDSGIPARQLILEITESVLIDHSHSITQLEQLRMMGVAISMDDFGTGYSSIARLQNLPVDIVKIDKSFMDPSRPTADKLLQLMVQAAHAFGLPVVAEGVEHDHQLDVLRSIDCESAQGYHLARPMTSSDVELHLGGRWH